jgi:hypothetical protein
VAASDRHVPAVHRDLDGSGAGDDPGRQGQAAHQDETAGTAALVTREQQLGGPVPEDLGQVIGGRLRRMLRVRIQAPGADGRLQVGHGFAQVAGERLQVPLRTRRGQRHLPRRDGCASTQGVADRARQKRHGAGPRAHSGVARIRAAPRFPPCHQLSRDQPPTRIDRSARHFSPVIGFPGAWRYRRGLGLTEDQRLQPGRVCTPRTGYRSAACSRARSLTRPPVARRFWGYRAGSCPAWATCARSWPTRACSRPG